MRVGFGYDVHRLVQGRDLILAGVKIPYHLGLLGHSDADVLTHALMDALLGAAALGDIGSHFPDTDVRYEGVSSILLLEKVKQLITDQGYRINNLDMTIAAESPKLKEYIPLMIDNLSEALGLNRGRINIKATTTEGLGFVGLGQGIAAYVVCVVGRFGGSVG